MPKYERAYYWWLIKPYQRQLQLSMCYKNMGVTKGLRPRHRSHKHSHKINCRPAVTWLMTDKLLAAINKMVMHRFWPFLTTLTAKKKYVNFIASAASAESACDWSDRDFVMPPIISSWIRVSNRAGFLFGSLNPKDDRALLNGFYFLANWTGSI